MASSARWSQSGPSTISERISVFEQKKVVSSTTMMSSPKVKQASKTTTNKNFIAIKSQFDSPSVQNHMPSEPAEVDDNNHQASPPPSASTSTNKKNPEKDVSDKSLVDSPARSASSARATKSANPVTPLPFSKSGYTAKTPVKLATRQSISPLDNKKQVLSSGLKSADNSKTATFAAATLGKKTSAGPTTRTSVVSKPSTVLATSSKSERPVLSRKESCRKPMSGNDRQKEAKDQRNMKKESLSSPEAKSSKMASPPLAFSKGSPPCASKSPLCPTGSTSESATILDPSISSATSSLPQPTSISKSAIPAHNSSLNDTRQTSKTPPPLSPCTSRPLSPDGNKEVEEVLLTIVDVSKVHQVVEELNLNIDEGPIYEKSLPVVPKLTLTVEDVSDDTTLHILQLDDNRTSLMSGLNWKNSLTSAEEMRRDGSVRSTYWSTQALKNDNAQKINEAMKLDLDYKEEKINALHKELEDLQPGGASEEEIAALKKTKHDLEGRVKEQEEEIDDLAGQVQMLEQAKIKLEMSIAAMKKEQRRELALKDEELEDARASSQKKVKILEQQLENEHEERINFVREKHELETKILNLQELASRSADEELVNKLKKDLKRTKALLKDAQLMVERSRVDSSNKVVLRQLKNQLEDVEFARTAAVKARQNLELDLADVQQQLEDVLRSRADMDDRLARLNREKADLSSTLEDAEEELQEVMRKYKASVSQLSVDQITLQEQGSRIADLEDECNKLKETIAELNQKIESLEGENVINAHQNRLELKIKELESKLELEHTTRGRMESQINRLKEAIEKLNAECESLRIKEQSSQEHGRKLQRQLRELREDYTSIQQKETEVNAKKNEMEKLLELAEAETVMVKNDLKLAMKRIEDLQTAINGDLDSESDSYNSDSDSDNSDMGSFLEHHRRACSVQRERESMTHDSEGFRASSIQRDVRLSTTRESAIRYLETMPEEPELKLSEGSIDVPTRKSSFSVDHHHELEGTLEDESVA